MLKHQRWREKQELTDLVEQLQGSDDLRTEYLR
jgi:hypothetical protein